MSITYAIVGKMGSGKSYLSDQLKEYYNRKGITVHFVAFADALKSSLEEAIAILGRNERNYEAVASEFGVPLSDVEYLFDEVLTGDLSEVSAYVKTDNMRKAYQFWSTVLKKKDPMIFTNLGISKATSLLSNQGGVIIFTDVRYTHELEAILENMSDVSVVRLDISEYERMKRIAVRDGFVPSIDSLLDESETHLDSFDFSKVEGTGNKYVVITLEDQVSGRSLFKAVAP